MSIKSYLTGRYSLSKPWPLISDFLFAVLIVMLVIPSTRSLILSGVAGVRTLFSSDGSKGPAAPLDAEDWSWQLTDMQGRTVPFSEFRGEVIFLNQWATWCPPCRAEMPSIEKLFREYGNRATFVMLTSEDPAKVREYMNRHGYTFPVWLGSVKGAGLRTGTIPATAVISRKGELVMARKGAFNWHARKVRKLMDRLIGEPR
jgi:thiol-disulfide isomerase/thioredoxin